MPLPTRMAATQPSSPALSAIDQRIGENLRTARIGGLFTPAELAACARLSVEELGDIEAGRRRASASQLWALSRELGASVHDLMAGAGGD